MQSVGGFFVAILGPALVLGLIFLRVGGWGWIKCKWHAHGFLSQIDRIVWRLAREHNVFLEVQDEVTNKSETTEDIHRKYCFSRLIYVVIIRPNGSVETFCGHPDGNSIHQFHVRDGVPDHVERDLKRIVTKEQEWRGSKN
jgi:hypothetical protein